MNQIATKLNKTGKIKNIEISIQLTPEQIVQVYQKLVKQKKNAEMDWIYQEPFISELKKRTEIANQEKKKNKLIPAFKLHKELGV